MKADEIWIIGTEPPCPRCDRLTRMVQDIVNQMGLACKVVHMDYTSVAAERFAASLGLVPGTAKDVAGKTGVAIDWDGVYGLMDEQVDPSANQCCATPGDRWSPELDEALDPCRRIAAGAGILMTPVLVVNGRLVHNGNVPSREQVLQWLGQSGGKSQQHRHVLEILGSGCPNCRILYENAAEAVQGAGLEGLALIKRSDILYFQQLGLRMTPGLAFNGKLLSAGKVLKPDQIRRILLAELGTLEMGAASGALANDAL